MFLFTSKLHLMSLMSTIENRLQHRTKPATFCGCNVLYNDCMYQICICCHPILKILLLLFRCHFIGARILYFILFISFLVRLFFSPLQDLMIRWQISLKWKNYLGVWGTVVVAFFAVSFLFGCSWCSSFVVRVGNSGV